MSVDNVCFFLNCYFRLGYDRSYWVLGSPVGVKQREITSPSYLFFIKYKGGGGWSVFHRHFDGKHPKTVFTLS